MKQPESNITDPTQAVSEFRRAWSVMQDREPTRRTSLIRVGDVVYLRRGGKNGDALRGERRPL